MPSAPFSAPASHGGQPAHKSTEDRRAALWAAAALLLLVVPLSGWVRLPAGERFSLPETPMDRTHPPYALQWAFLWQAREVLPERASYTVRAADPEQEWSLFMMSLGVLNEHTALPFRYFGTAHRELAGKARFILDFGCHLKPGGDLHVFARWDRGCLLERRSAAPHGGP